MLLLFVLLLAAESKHTAVPSDQFGELVFVTLVMRHSDRAPIVPYPTSPYGASYWPNGWGQLTDVGKEQAYFHGLWLRDRYKMFLPPNYNVQDLRIDSTDVDRAIMTANLIVSGLYKPTGLETQPVSYPAVPVHTASDIFDRLLLNNAPCPLYNLLFWKTIKQEEQIMLPNYSHLLPQLSNLAGTRYKSVHELLDLYNTLHVEHISGLLLPSWAQQYYPEPLQTIANWAFKLQVSSPDLCRLKAGPFIKKILQHMLDKRNGGLTTKLWMLSAHDTTLINVMSCLGIYNDILPPYKSTLMFELFRTSQDEYNVVMSYKNSTRPPHLLKLTSCGVSCPLDRFDSLLRPIVPQNWDRECEPRHKDND